MDSEGLGYTSENIETVVLQFYREPTNDKLNSFLTQAQSSKEAWFFSWELLKVDKPSVVQYYGANTLHLKISKHWYEIPDDYIPSLRSSLLQLLESHSKSLRAIIIRICVCLGCFILQTMSQQWPNALGELITSALQPCGDDVEKKSTHQKNMLEILTVIPEEFPSIYLSQSKKSQVANELMNSSNSVLQLIHQLLVEDWPQASVKGQAIKCFTSWLNLGICVVQPENEPLVFLLFDLLRSPTYFMETAEALMQLFKIPLNHKYPKTVLKYLKKVAELSPLFESESHDIDITQSLTKIFVSAAENNSELMLTSIASNNEDSQIAVDLLQLIVKTVSIKAQYPTEELCSDLSFGFWYNFQDDVSQKSHPPHVTEMMRILFLDMFNVMTFKTKFPPDNEYNHWGTDDKEVFRCYRQDFADAAAYFSSFVGSESMRRMLQLLTNHLTVLHNNINVDWQEFDSVIYMMTSIMEGGNLSELDSIKEIYSLLPHVPCTHNILITQIMFFIGSCAEVMDAGMFVHSIDFILKGLQQKEISSAASMSLKDLLLANRERIGMVSKEVLQGLKEAMERGDMEPPDYVRLAHCLGYVLPVVRQEDALKVIEVILMPLVNNLLSITDKSQISGQSMNLMVMYKLKMLAGFFSSFSFPEDQPQMVYVNHFIFQFLEQLLPCLKQVISVHILDEYVMNELFELLKRSVNSLVPYFGLVAPDYCQVICSSFSLNPLPCILDFAKSVFIATTTDEQLQSILKSTFIHICNQSMHFLGQDPQNHPDVMEAFMNFLSQLSKKVPALLNCESDCLFKLFGAAMAGIEMKENQASKSSCQFLATLILNTDLTQAVQVQGRRLLEVIVLVGFTFVFID